VELLGYASAGLGVPEEEADEEGLHLGQLHCTAGTPLDGQAEVETLQGQQETDAPTVDVLLRRLIPRSGQETVLKA
jgi:hypothetical protein